MGQPESPTHGSMQYWPRKRSSRPYAGKNYFGSSKDVKILGFCGYKAGMTHLIFTDKKDGDRAVAATVLECPPMRAFGIRLYTKTIDGKKVSVDIAGEKLEKELGRKLNIPKKSPQHKDSKDFCEVRLLVHTHPKMTGIGKKRPEVFEIGIGGKIDDALAYAKEKLGKDIIISEIFKSGELVDTHSVTKGKGYQGPIKRFGVSIRHHKSEKTKRGPGSLGAWRGQAHIMWRVAHAGQMGYHLRTSYNKQILLIGNKPEEINQSGGFIHYGLIKNDYILLRGSIDGPAKRLIRFNIATRPSRATKKPLKEIKYMSITSKQGN